MSKPTALIYGHDGFDPDVSFNMLDFYSDLGFQVRFSRKLISSDLLCVQRTPKSILDLSKFSSIHVWDYVCGENQEFLQSLTPDLNFMVLFPSYERMSQQLNRVPGIENFSLMSLPPVSTQRWTLKPNSKNLKYDGVHIGHFKPKPPDSDDIHYSGFLKLAQSQGIQVWGRGWDNVLEKPNNHGIAKVHSSKKIYSAARYSLGVMYPHQRNLTISGRFWQAPLTGTPLLIEPNIQSRHLPGIYEVDYSDINNFQPSKLVFPDKNVIYQESLYYWNKHYQEMLLIFRLSLRNNFRVASKTRSQKYRSKLDLKSTPRIHNLKFSLRLR